MSPAPPKSRAACGGPPISRPAGPVRSQRQRHGAPATAARDSACPRAHFCPALARVSGPHYAPAPKAKIAAGLGGAPQDGGAKECFWNAYLRFFHRSSAEDILVHINVSWGNETADLHLRMPRWTPRRTKGDIQQSHPRVPPYRAVASQHAALALNR
jgi:hypothetical protein